jgi:hypothetical protein
MSRIASRFRWSPCVCSDVGAVDEGLGGLEDLADLTLGDHLERPLAAEDPVASAEPLADTPGRERFELDAGQRLIVTELSEQ